MMWLLRETACFLLCVTTMTSEARRQVVLVRVDDDVVRPPPPPPPPPRPPRPPIHPPFPPRDPSDRCFESPFQGARCPAGYPDFESPSRRYSFDSRTRSCRSFTFGGCDGNRNNFITVQSCRRQCRLNGEINECLLRPFAEGRSCYPPVETVERFSYSIETETCLPFKFRGCGGTDNNFRTLRGCQNFCNGTLADRCYRSGSSLFPQPGDSRFSCTVDKGCNACTECACTYGGRLVARSCTEKICRDEL